jgi:hypothetical protein
MKKTEPELPKFPSARQQKNADDALFTEANRQQQSGF